VHGEAVLGLQRPCVRDELLRGPDLGHPRLRWVAEEQVRGERDGVTQLPAQQVMNRNAQVLPDQVQAGEFDGSVQLGPVTVQRGRRIGDLEAECLELERIVTGEVGREGAEGHLGALPATAHLPQPDQAGVGLHLHDRPDEPAPVRAVGVQQRGLERDGNGRGANVSYLHVPGISAWFVACAGWRRVRRAGATA
jgi:hypothetical protein